MTLGSKLLVGYNTYSELPKLKNRTLIVVDRMNISSHITMNVIGIEVK